MSNQTSQLVSFLGGVLPWVWSEPPASPLRVERGGHQWLPVSAHIRERYLVTYRAPAERLAALVPAPLTIDARDGFGFVSVCALEIDDMGIVGLPRGLRFENRELLYRVGVRVDGRPSFFTLRSDVSSRALAFLGRRFSHYRLRLGDLPPRRDVTGRLQLICKSGDGRADACFEAAPAPCPAPRGSLFASADEATRFLLGMTFSVDVAARGRVRVQDIEHDPWRACFAEPSQRRFDFIDHLGRALGTRLDYDHTLAMTDLRQIWRAARWI
jgi:uncharacterized protein YqjF (DUF2071 family)